MCFEYASCVGVTVGLGPVGFLLPFVGLLGGIGQGYPGDYFHSQIVKTETYANRYRSAFNLLGDNDITRTFRARIDARPDPSAGSTQLTLDRYLASTNDVMSGFYEATAQLDQKYKFVNDFDPRADVSFKDKVEEAIDFGLNKDLAQQFGYDRLKARAFNFNAVVAQYFGFDLATAAATYKQYYFRSGSRGVPSYDYLSVDPESGLDSVDEDTIDRILTTKYFTDIGNRVPVGSPAYEKVYADIKYLRASNTSWFPAPPISGLPPLLNGGNSFATLEELLVTRANDVAPDGVKKPFVTPPAPALPDISIRLSQVSQFLQQIRDVSTNVNLFKDGLVYGYLTSTVPGLQDSVYEFDNDGVPFNSGQIAGDVLAQLQGILQVGAGGTGATAGAGIVLGGGETVVAVPVGSGVVVLSAELARQGGILVNNAGSNLGQDFSKFFSQSPLEGYVNRGNFAPRGERSGGSINETQRTFSNEEKLTAETLQKEGYTVESLPESNVESVRSPDSLVTDPLTGKQLKVEFKNLKSNPEKPIADSRNILSLLNDSLDGQGQARHLIFNSKGSGLTPDEALRAFRRINGITRGKIDSVRIIGDGFDISTAYPYAP